MTTNDLLKIHNIRIFFVYLLSTISILKTQAQPSKTVIININMKLISYVQTWVVYFKEHRHSFLRDKTNRLLNKCSLKPNDQPVISNNPNAAKKSYREIK